MWRTSGRPRIADAPEDALETATRYDLPAPPPRQTAEYTRWMQAVDVGNTCYRVIAQLQQQERWRAIYSCATCGRWFRAERDPRQADQPYCSRWCWPSRSLAIPTRP